MIKSADIELRNTTCFISGDLDFNNVMIIYEKSLDLILNCPELIFDLSALRSSNSAGLALLVEWIKLSEQRNKSITFKHLSKHLVSLAKAAGIAGLLRENPASY